MRKRNVLLGGLTVVGALLFVLNASFLAKPADEFAVLAHRGVYQTYDKTGVGRDDCTATRIYPPTHAFLENTLPSIQAAIAAGADIIELDVHPTMDGEFAVFHDWTIDCRTNGSGVTREQSMAALKALDIGHGYTSDDGKTFPFRGKFFGAMPTLGEVLAAFPQQRFLINHKSRDATEADKLDAYLEARPDARPQRLAIFAHERIVTRMRVLRPHLRATSRAQLKDCARGYLLTGWTGFVPASCRDTTIYLPINWAWAAWGYPDRLLARMQAANTDVMLVGPLTRMQGVAGIDDANTAAMIPSTWRGGVVTDRVDITGPLLKASHRHE
jgi:glycerophosphoryl diester phosphodiesterase